jgi:hypothetical protein
MTKFEQEVFEGELRQKTPSMIDELKFLYNDRDTFGVVFVNPKNASSAHWIGDFNNSKKKVVSGFFDDQSVALKSVLKIDDVALPEGIFVTLNGHQGAKWPKINERLYANDLMLEDGAFERISNIFVDISPVSPENLSATEKEKGYAMAIAETISNDMLANNWPEPMFGDTGNGASLVYKTDLENSLESIQLIERGFEGACEAYATDAVNVAVRYAGTALVPLMGAWVRVGEDLPNRPHRMSKVISIPSVVKTISKKMLESLIPGESITQTPTESAKQGKNEEAIKVEKITRPGLKATVLSGKDILQFKLPNESAAIIENFVVKREITSISSSQDNGKSVLAINLALAIGSPLIDNVFGYQVHNHCNSLFLNSQSIITNIRDRISKMCVNNIALQAGIENVHYLALDENEIRIVGRKLSENELMDIITDNIFKSNSQVVIYDHVTDFMDSENPVAIRKNISKIQTIADRTNTAAVVIHSEETNVSSPIGNEIYRNVDNVFNISYSSNNGGLLIFKCEKARNFDKPEPIAIEMNQNLIFQKIELKLPKNKQVRQQVDTNTIVDALKELGGVVQKQAILIDKVVAEAGVSQSTVRKLIMEGVNQGLIIEQQSPISGRDKSYNLA